MAAELNEMGAANNMSLLSQLNINPAYQLSVNRKTSWARDQQLSFKDACKKADKVYFRRKDEMSQYAEAWVKFRHQLRAR